MILTYDTINQLQVIITTSTKLGFCKNLATMSLISYWFVMR